MMKSKLTKREKIVLLDLFTNGGFQSSWDWPADQRFAAAMGFEKEASDIQEASDSAAPAVFRWRVVHYSGIPKKRLYVLRCLLKKGMVRASWSGMGAGSYNELNTRRNRDYWITPKGKVLAQLITDIERDIHAGKYEVSETFQGLPIDK